MKTSFTKIQWIVAVGALLVASALLAQSSSRANDQEAAVKPATDNDLVRTKLAPQFVQNLQRVGLGSRSHRDFRKFTDVTCLKPEAILGSK